MIFQQLLWTGQAPMQGSSKIKASETEPCFSSGKADTSLLEDQETQKSLLTNGNHICKLCQKQFMSGRALGGHMRVHGSVFSQSEAALTSWHTNTEAKEMKDSCTHALGSSPASFLSPSGKGPIGSEKPRVKAINRQDDSLKSGHASQDDEEVSVKGSGSSGLKYSAADDGSLAFNASDCKLVDGKTFGLDKKGRRQLYTLRRNPKPRKRFEDEEYTMDMVSSAPAKKTSCLVAKASKGFECTECGRRFVSSKALFGHMRCHPEREWRGFHPPKTEESSINSEMKNTQSSSNSPWQNSPSPPGDQMVNVDSNSDSDAESIEAAYIHRKYKSSLQSWMRGKRSKRSRQSMRLLQETPHETSEGGQLNDYLGIKEDRDMADCLVMLADAGRIQEELEPAKKRAALGSINSNRNKPRKSGPEDGEWELDSNRNQSRSSNTESSSMLKEKSRESEQLDQVQEKQEAREIEDTEIKYECHSCKRVFKSHQALGGHRASHRKVKGCFSRAHAYDIWGPYTPNAEEVFSNGIHNLQIDSNKCGIRTGDENVKANPKQIFQNPRLQKMIKSHECSICHKVFLSGQALGGHKRCHWGGAVPSQSSPSDSFSQKQDKESLEEELLDLNLPAPKEEAHDSILPLTAASPKTHMPFSPNKFSPYRNTLTEIIPPNDGIHNMDCSTSCDNKLPKMPSISRGTSCYVAEDAGCVAQGLILADHVDSTAFHPLYDKASNLHSHESKYTSTIDSVTGLTPVSA